VILYFLVSFNDAAKYAAENNRVMANNEWETMGKEELRVLVLIQSFFFYL